MLIIAWRFFTERFIFKQFGIAAGLKDRSETYKTKKSPNAICSDPRLDLLWKTKKSQMLTFSKSVLEYVKELGSLELSQRQLERWIQRKANSERSFRLERSWRMIFYAFAFCFGIFTLWYKEWFWDSDGCLKSYPCQVVSDSGSGGTTTLRLSFISHISSLCSRMHHRRTSCKCWSIIWLRSCCWSSPGLSTLWMGTLVLVIYGFADIPLEAAKLYRYLKVSPLVSIFIFGFFALYWTVSRLGILPHRVRIHTLYYALVRVEFLPVYWILNALLIVLQILHDIWTFMILRIVSNTIHDT